MQCTVIEKTYIFNAGNATDGFVGRNCLLSVKYSAVVESSEMPPLPVSSIKFSVSGKLSSLACNIITPPVNCTK